MQLLVYIVLSLVKYLMKKTTFNFEEEMVRTTVVCTSKYYTTAA